MSDFDDKLFATSYRETETDHDVDEVETPDLAREEAIEIRYRTTAGSSKTVRGESPRTPTSPERYDDLDADDIVFYDSGQKYRFRPETGELRTINTNARNAVVATADDVLDLRTIEYPRSVPVTGAVQEGVEATVYYRSFRSDDVIEMHVEDVRRVEGSGSRVQFSAHDPRRDRDVEIQTAWSRAVTTKSYRHEEQIGRVERVEFPDGHGFTIEAHNLPDDRARSFKKSIESRLQKLEGTVGEGNDVEIRVSHDGRLDD